MKSDDLALAFIDESRLPARQPARASSAFRTGRCAVLFWLFASPLFALNPGLAIKQYLHTKWTQEEGYSLPPVQAITQTRDGYLWLGTGTGLIRFDGLRFVPWPVHAISEGIRCLVAGSDGSLWTGTQSSFWDSRRGKTRSQVPLEILPCHMITAALEDTARGVWVLTSCPNTGSLILLPPGGSPRSFTVDDGLPEQKAETISRGRNGDLWIGISGGICKWSPGNKADCLKSPGLLPMSVITNETGEIFVADNKTKRVLKIVNRELVPVSPAIADAPFAYGAMLSDRDNNIWIGTVGKGLLRLHAGVVDRYSRAEGLSSDLIAGLVQDREGVLWVGTARGIDRFRDPNVRILSKPDGLSGDVVSAVLGGHDGSTWVGTAGAGLNRVDGDRVTVYSASTGLPSGVVLSLYEDLSQQLWVGTPGGLVVRSGGRFAEALTAEGERLRRVANISGNRSGALLVFDNQRGLFTIQNRTARPLKVPGLDSRTVYRILLANDGSIWLGHFDDKAGGVSVVREEKLVHYDSRDGIARGPVRALYEDREGAIWVGTGEGLSRFQNGRWTSWTAPGLRHGGVHAIQEDQSDGLWLVTPGGVLRLSRANLDSPGKPLEYILYGHTEGLRLLQSGGMATPKLTRARDGRLWLSTEDGAAIVDPTRVRINPVPPPVVIEQATLDGRDLDIGAGREIGFRGQNLQIAYTGNSLMAPERVRFKYFMHGLDHEWTDAGTRRNVTYVNLSPGHYRFQVIAANNDGVWNKTGAEIALQVYPYFYQTWWFYGACLGCIGLAVFAVHRLRIRRVVSRFQLIAAERTRFTRELHDSLLQGFSGVIFQLEAAVRQFEAAPLAAKQKLMKALDQADESLREGREMIQSMRIPALENCTLPEALSVTTRRIADGMPLEFDFKTTGRVRQGHYDLEANMFLVVREAVTNAVNHAAPKHIGVEMHYTGKGLQVTVLDDGAGFDPDQAMAKTGHWGLRGMQERVKLIGGTFEVQTAPGRGTRLAISVPWKTQGNQ